MIVILSSYILFTRETFSGVDIVVLKLEVALLRAVVVEVEAVEVSLEDIVNTEEVVFVVDVTTGVFDVDEVVVGDNVGVIIDFEDVTVEVVDVDDVVEVFSAIDVFAVVVDTNNVVLVVLNIDSVVIFFEEVDVGDSDAVNEGFDVVTDDGDVVFEVVDISVLMFV